MGKDLFTQMKEAYDRAYKEAQLDDEVTLDDISIAAKINLYKARHDNIKCECNKREHFDDKGDFVPKDSFYEVINIPKSKFDELNGNEIEPPANNSWVCDKCMKLNLVPQEYCNECGDELDEKDEVLE